MKSDWKRGEVKMNRYSPADHATVELDTYVNRKCRSSTNKSDSVCFNDRRNENFILKDVTGEQKEVPAAIVL